MSLTMDTVFPRVICSTIVSTIVSTTWLIEYVERPLMLGLFRNSSFNDANVTFKRSLL